MVNYPKPLLIFPLLYYLPPRVLFSDLGLLHLLFQLIKFIYCTKHFDIHCYCDSYLL